MSEADAESLATRFYRAQRLAQQAGRTAEQATTLIELLQSLTVLIDQAALFSSNEEVDDLSTGSMKYLLASYYAGSVELSFPGGISERLQHLTSALTHFQAFVKRLEEYNLADKAEVSQFKESLATFQTKLNGRGNSASARPPPSRPTDPNAARTAKIARFKRERELTAQLEAMQQTRRNRVQAQSSSSSSSTIGAQEVDEESIDQACDEDAVRAFYSLLFQSLLLTCVDAARSGVDEVDILLHHRDVELKKPREQQLANLSDAERAKQIAADPIASKKPVMFKMTPESLMQPIPEHMKHILQNVAQPAAASSSTPNAAAASSSSSSTSFTPSTVNNRIDSIISSRANARAEVFKLTNQPTYSIEQWAEMEIAAGRMPGPDANPPPRQPDPRRIRSAANREIAEEMVAEFERTQLEDEEGLGHEDGLAGNDADDLRKLKARDWDNWADDHQKGVGNSIK